MRLETRIRLESAIRKAAANYFEVSTDDVYVREIDEENRIAYFKISGRAYDCRITKNMQFVVKDSIRIQN